MINLQGRYKLKVYDKDGKMLEETSWKHNTITNSGLASVSGLLGDTGSKSAFQFLAVGTDNTAEAAAHTGLQAETTDTGLDRVVATTSQVTTTQTSDTLQFIHTWTATGSKTIEEVGIFDTATSSAGTMLGRSLTGSKALTTGQMLELTYQVITS